MLARRLIPLLAVTALALAGCGGSSGNGGTTGTTIAAKPGSTRAISGPFAGKLTQAGLAPFRIGVLLAPNGTGRVAYTGIRCAGNWTLESRQGANTYTFTERINSGAGGQCQGTGTLHLRQTPGGTLRYRFTGGGVTSSGFLVPASPRAVRSVFRQVGIVAIPH